MKSILICDDEFDVVDMFSDEFETTFSNPTILQAYGLEQAIALSRPEVMKNNLGLVFTDGTLYRSGSLEKTGHGCDLKKALRDIGYKGPIVYIGLSTPEKRINEFTRVIRKAELPEDEGKYEFGYKAMAKYAKTIFDMYEMRANENQLLPGIELETLLEEWYSF
ncbi:MAG: hypothetical protein WC755_02350 [Candidatus Woesearchaeota archaeon]|jgi:hypothetical protein